MEFMKKIIVLVILVLFAVSVNSQSSTQEVIEAFTKSYELEESGEYAKAIASMKSVYDENSYEINLRLGWLTYSIGSFTQSMAYYNNAITLMPYSVEAKLGLIYPVYATGKTDQVISLYKDILQISPNYYTALYNL